MTTQIPDSLTFEGRKWVIEWWNGDNGCIPTNQSLGFETVSPATNNWAGRINHFLVHHKQLMLFKVEVSLHPDSKGILPFGARRELVVRYEQLERWGGEGMKLIEHPREYEFLVYDDVPIRFTGIISLSYPYFDCWELPWPITEMDEETDRGAEATFEEGILVSWNEYPAVG